ncbi:MBL fold metallo-hydrolase [Desulfomonile tiedjei]|uniref:Putative Zn-dependent hydrolase of beta-lactamase fold protein n=1 Tax=Desulfomonile tiedjei (strain ATCC 49306 / DSM 6799 / DCB-1) TaxID=706587 RepID=I4CC30_DESTA|nr:MBL fold metallo-hydrolase [Desulfomonile tiedjei]AFM27121.1 putative Zn-dependent hydrolase of beta-lactamase fold protein [Desulfomonile tiedjei DSM 6799]
MRVLLYIFLLLVPALAYAASALETDVIKTSDGDLKITFIGHGTLMFEYKGKVIHIDPYGKLADFSNFPKADLILITHEHQDHLDPTALNKVKTDKTKLVVTETVGKNLPGRIVMHNGDAKTVDGIKIEAVPAYNLVHMRSAGVPFHPKGVGNGYVLTFGDKRVYVAGDTENTPEMKQLANIDIAFLPMNLPYTMTPEMVTDAAKAFKPKILYPYHTGDTDLSKLTALMKGTEGVEVRLRKMK